MKGKEGSERMCVTLTRDEFPLLDNHVMSLPKGRRRAIRLKVLAAQGLHAESRTLLGALAPAASNAAVREASDVSPILRARASIAVSQVLDEPLEE